MNLSHSDANILRDNPEGDVPDDVLSAYLTRYAVRWIVVTSAKPALESRPGLIELEAIVPPHRIYRSKLPCSLLQQGRGRVEAALNSISVTGSDPDEDLVLKFHWIETFACAPACKAVMEPVAGDPVGFVRIPAPHPPDLVVENGY